MFENVKTVSYKAIIIGFLVDFFGSLIAGILFGFCYTFYLVFQKTPQEKILTELQNGMPTLITELFLGFAFTVFGGYIAGRIAKKNYILHGAIVGILSVLVGFFMLQFTKFPMWYVVISTLLVVPFAIAGGMLAQKRDSRNSS